MKIKVAHISTGFETGGAEIQLLRLLSKFDRQKFEMMVIGLDRNTYLGDRMRELGMPVYALDIKHKPWNTLNAYRQLKTFNPDVIHGTMYEGGVFGSLLRSFLPKKPAVIWTSHEPLEHYDKESLRKKMQLRLWGKLSSLPECMMYVSHLNKEQHLDWGFNNDKAIVIPNGVDSERFFPNLEARKKIRSELHIADDTFVIGKVARYHQQKNHIGFLQAAAQVLEKHPHVQFILAGTGVDDNNSTLTTLAHSLGLQNNLHMLGNREDVPDVVNAFDLSTLTSLGEAFPLTLGEAMVSSVPCVATDVGDNDYIISDTGIVVPPRDNKAMAEAWITMVDMQKPDLIRLGARARERCLDNFTLEQQVKQHESLYSVLAEKTLSNGTINKDHLASTS